jgi:hypothetical protein
MIVFQGNLYLAEGFPKANVSKYDGTNWSVVVPGPTPFDPLNGGLVSLAIFKDKLYVGTVRGPYMGSTQGDQVWGYPYLFPSLAAAFGADGLWLYRNGAWAKLSISPNHMVSYGNKLVASFPGEGLYEYNGTLWIQLSPNGNVENLVGVSNGFYADFGGAGLYKYSNGWTQIASANPAKMAANGNNLLATFSGWGLWQYDGNSTWTCLSSYDGAENVLGISGKVYGDAGDLGLWKYNGAWTNISPVNPNIIQTYDGKLVANFLGFGLFEYDGISWTSWLTSVDSVQDFIGVSSSLYADYGAFGLWKYSAGTWTGIAPIHANRLGSYGQKLVANFVGFGLFEYDGSNWTWLVGNDGVTEMVAVDLP